MSEIEMLLTKLGTADPNQKRQIGLKVWEIIHRYERAVKMLEECGEITHEKFCEIVRVAGSNPSEPRMHMTWENADKVFKEGYPGKQAVIPMLREGFKDAISKFKTVADKCGVSEPTEAGGTKKGGGFTDNETQIKQQEKMRKKWWHFWK